MLLLIFAGLIGVTLLEFYVVIQVGHAIGVLPTLGLMVLDALIGSALMRSQGRAAWRRLRLALAERRPPAREVLDGALILAGGAFLITPGFVTDVFGALLLAPPTRALARRWIVRRFASRLVGGPGPRRGWSAWRPAPGGPHDVDGEAVEIVEPRELRP